MTTGADAAIRVERVVKTYRVWNSPGDRLYVPALRWLQPRLQRVAGAPNGLRRRALDAITRRAERGCDEYTALNDVSIELARGDALGIVGPNGSGKSTLLEAIAWALYGTAAARGTRDTIKRRGAPPRARVEVELVFTLGSHRYRLQRTLTNAELEQDGEIIANSSATVTSRVVALLGMTREERIQLRPPTRVETLQALGQELFEALGVGAGQRRVISKVSLTRIRPKQEPPIRS